MKSIGLTSAAIAAMLLGIAVPAYAEQGSQGAHSSSQGHGQQHSKSNSKKSRRAQEQERTRHDAWQQHRTTNWESDHQSWQQRGGYRGYRIPDSRYRRYFGPQHYFRVNTLPFRVVSGQPRFQYRGYWMTLEDRWPGNWDQNWYSNDDMYVNYVDNGYYLFNRRHPDVAVSIRISL
jgi:hypothetical protein